MDLNKKQELSKLATQYLNIAATHVKASTNLSEQLRKSLSGGSITEEAELPGYETRPMKFGKFVNDEFVVMMTDIRKSTNIVNGPNGLVNMFLIFYVYAGIIAKIVDSNKGTSTEFLGDGVLNLFSIKELTRDTALMNSMQASWDIMEAKDQILNPIFSSAGLPIIDLGIGIDHGITIVTQFGYRGDTDLKAFGKCAYNASKLSKGFNEIRVSETSKGVWPIGPGGALQFGYPTIVDGVTAYTAHKIVS